MSKPRFRLHVAPLVEGITDKYLWWYITLPDGRNTTRCRTPAEIFKRSERLRVYARAWENRHGTEARRAEQSNELPQQGER